MKLKLIVTAVALSWGTAQAGIIQIGGQAAGTAGKISARAGVCTVTFDANNSVNSCGATYTPATGNNYRTGSFPGTAASPANDTTGYLTVGPFDGTPIVITLAAPANYFGFYAGSLDPFNSVQFLLNGVVVDSFTGTQINAVAFPGTGTNGDQSRAEYIDYFPGTFVSGSFVASLYNSIVYSSSDNAFETDSHAFGLVTPNAVPEPESVALLGLGALALFAGRRRKARKA